MKMRNAGLVGIRLEILRLMQRAGGPVTEELIRYQVWRRRGTREPVDIQNNFSYIRHITGLGIVRCGAAGWMLTPHLDEPWCDRERWKDA